MMTAINAALYAAVGALWTVFPITVYGVRFWPQVFVPATFSVLFGAWPGGVGAGIGIFIADVLYGHHDALLSLLVGVPSNFVGFFLIGWLTNRPLTGAVRRVIIAVSLLIPIVFAGYGVTLLAGPEGFASPQVFIAVVGVIAVLAILGFAIVKNRWADFESAASIGLGLGSLIIGVGIVVYSFVFTLPGVVQRDLGSGTLPVAIVYAVSAFTYLSEIPFLVLLTPPVVTACRAAFPSLRIGSTTGAKPH
jgi:hypothetical protein